MKHGEFADRAGRRLEAVADRLEVESEAPGLEGGARATMARAQELRVAALLVREEAAAVSRKERGATGQMFAESPSPEAQGRTPRQRSRDADRLREPDGARA